MDATCERTSSPSLPQNFDELHAETLRMAAACVVPVIMGFLVFAATDLEVRQRFEMWLVVLGLAASGTLVYRLVRDQNRAAAPAFVTGLVANILLVLALFPGTQMIFALALISLAAGIFFRPLACAGLTALTAALAAVLTLRSDGAWSPADMGPLLFLIVACGILSWLGTRPVSIALDWYGASYEQARAMATELQQHRGELVRLSQQLNLWVNRLEEANYELDRARREADAARRLKNEFATAISHELRTPLNLIIGYSEMLDRALHGGANPLESPQLAGDIEAIHRNAVHISDLIADVLDLSRIETHRFALQKQSISIEQCVDEAVRAVRGLVDSASVELRVTVRDTLPEVNADPVRVRQVLINLLGNAARHTEEGWIEVHAEDDENHVVISVSDTGVGIAASDLPWVFEEFRQVGDPRRRRGGSGIGLTVARSFVEMHGGNIWVESSPGVGSTFRFTLPLHGQVIAQPVLRDPRRWGAALSPHADRVLVLARPEDDTLRLFRSYLDGPEVCAVTDLEEASREVETRGAAALLLPRHRASLKLERVALATPALADVPLLVYSFRSPRIADKLEIAEYLVKPVRRDVLVAAIRRVVTTVRTVLVVDDDSDLLDVLSRTIGQEFPRCRVLRAADGAAALRTMRDERLDLVLLDLLMPEADGYEVLATRKDDPALTAIPIIVVSAKGVGDETITVDSFGLQRGRGFSVAEVMRFTQACLGALLSPTDSSAQESSEDPSG